MLGVWVDAVRNLWCLISHFGDVGLPRAADGGWDEIERSKGGWYIKAGATGTAATSQ